MTWDYSDQLHATAIQNVNNGGVPETTWYVYDSNGNRIRKVTERFAAAGATPARLKDRFYLENYEVYLEYNGGGTTVTLQRDTLHIMDDKARVALVDSRKLGDEPGTPQKLFRYQLGNLLGSVSLELDDQAQIVSYEEYTAFGSTSYQAVRSQRETPKRYAYTGKEHDEENGLHYYGARYYACWLGRWASTDPAVFHPVNSNTHANSSAKTPDHHHCCCSPYVYVDNRPTIAVDPDGRDAVYITYPEYRAKVSLNKIGINASIHVPSGHAGILLIDNKTGTTKYYEYGRYDKAERGLVHKNAHPLPSVKIGPDGHATDASLVPVLAQLSRDHGDGGRIEAAYIQSDKFKEMNDYANKKFLENDDSHRKDYSVYTHNCATFASDVVQQDESVSKPTIIIPTPVNAVDEYQEEGNRKIEYPPPPAAAAPGIPGAPKKEADPKSKPKGGDAKPKPGPKTTPGGKKPQAPPLSTTKKQNATPDSRQVKGRVVN
jgi:RHS repeat-associated protein